MGIKSIFGGIFIAAMTIIGLTVIFGSWYTVDDGYRGVLLRNGAFVSVAEPGLNFKTPWIEEVYHISVRDNVRTYETVETYSRDQQLATLKVTVNYRIPTDMVRDVYTNYGGEENLVSRLLDRQVNEKVKSVFGQFNAATAIQERARLNKQVFDNITDSIEGPIHVSSIQVEDIAFSAAYEQSIEERMRAEVEVQRLTQAHEQAKVQANILVTEANARADAVRAEAQAAAEATILRGDAEAKAINARGRALRDNPDLVALVQAERWDGKLPSQMIPGGTVPFLNVSPNDTTP